MPKFEYACRDCEICWELEAPVGQAPKEPECPKCEKPGFRYYGNQYLNISFKDDGTGNQKGKRGAMDFQTVRRRYQKFFEKGYDKDSAHRWYKNEIEASKQHMKSGHMHYKPMNFDLKWWEEKGLAKKVTKKRRAEKLKAAKEMTGAAYNKLGIHPLDDRANKQTGAPKPKKPD